MRQETTNINKALKDTTESMGSINRLIDSLSDEGFEFFKINFPSN